MARDKSDGSRVLTFTEQARREQLVGVTIELVAERGYAGTSLAGIAAAAEITKAAVLYHFGSKDAVVQAALDCVLDSLVAEVGEAVAEAEPADRPAVYVRTMIAHLHRHPRHIRMMAEALINQPQDLDRGRRWRDLAAIMAEARRDRRRPGDADLRSLAIIVGGGIDAIMRERLVDPAYDTAGAAHELVRMMEHLLFD
ncbi:TetR/AcrR family transcriptional regulator [Pseudactinotalea sp. Z1732]|uniref:TetR/AcrR family transcriptional regulator n=2 Tax=Micrococcales TaxID=85006 RepID=UPI003C7D9B72